MTDDRRKRFFQAGQGPWYWAIGNVFLAVALAAAIVGGQWAAVPLFLIGLGIGGYQISKRMRNRT